MDAGDFSDPQEPTGKVRSQFIFRMLNRLRYDAIGYGEREYRLGVAAFDTDDLSDPHVIVSNARTVPTASEAAPATGTPPSSADALGQPIGKPYVIKDAGSVRVGIFGLASPNLSDRLREFGEGYSFQSPFEVTPPILKVFEREHVDVVVLLSQLEPALNDSLLTAFDAIDVVVLGNSLARPVQKNETRSYRAVSIFPESRGQALAHAELTVDPQGNVVDSNVQRMEMDGRVRTDADVQTLMDELAVQLQKIDEEARSARVAEQDNRGRADRFLGGQICGRCHEPEVASWRATTHATAFETLTKLGMEASGDCLPCHTVGHGQPSGFTSRAARPDLSGVQCESCHGFGSGHHTDLKVATAEAMCRTCHDATNSPEFNFQAYMAKIRHW